MYVIACISDSVLFYNKQFMIMKLLSLISIFLFFNFTSPTKINVKETQKSFVKVTDQLYASKYEVSNLQYRTFLNDLELHHPELAKTTCRIQQEQWVAGENNEYLSPFKELYHSHPAYNDYPVVNISYEAASRYCEWLTEQYNGSPKRKFDKVKFRLPTEIEWNQAAYAGNKMKQYAWKGEEVVDKKGRYMANYYRHDEMNELGVTKLFTTPVQAYMPNECGIYNMSGNVAEMVRGGDLLKGGSWKSEIEEVKIHSKQVFDGVAKPTIGFRVFMEVM